MLTWKDIKNDVIMESLKLNKDTLDHETGQCILDIIDGKYKGCSVEGKMIFGMYENVMTIQENSMVYVPVGSCLIADGQPEEKEQVDPRFTTKKKIVKY